MTKEDYFDGILKSLSNATDLYNDAEILYQKNRVSRAYTLYQLSIEEIGKASLIFSFILHKDYKCKKEQRRFKKEFLSHKVKTSQAIARDVFFAMLIDDKKLKSKIVYNVNKQRQSIDKLNNLKNSSLYTDLRKESFLLPKDVITQKMTSDIRFFANFRLSYSKQLYEIGIEHFGKLQESSKGIDEKEMIDKFLEEISEVIKF